jgi:hypothetical protein
MTESIRGEVRVRDDTHQRTVGVDDGQAHDDRRPKDEVSLLQGRIDGNGTWAGSHHIRDHGFSAGHVHILQARHIVAPDHDLRLGPTGLNARLGVSGGTLYDAHIGAAARQHRRQLLSTDVHARSVDEALGEEVWHPRAGTPSGARLQPFSAAASDSSQRPRSW